MIRRARARALAAVAGLVGLAAAAAAAGCSAVTDSFVSNDFSGDEFPIRVDVSSGAVVVGLRQEGAAADGGPIDRVALLDVLSPVTLVDPGPTARASIGTAQLTLLGAAADGSLSIPRARFRDTELLSLHPCAGETCAVGAPPGLPFDAILGANALAGDALRLRLDPAAPTAYVLADVGGSDLDRTFVCDAVFPSPYRGGGTLVVAGTEVPFGGRRITLQACLGGDPRRQPQSQRGADALLVLSTGIGVTLLGETAYARYRQIRPGPDLAGLPVEEVLLPSGPVAGRRVQIDRLWLAAASSSAPRAPCRQIYAHELLTVRDCDGDVDCPCDGEEPFCSVPAVVDLRPTSGLDVLVIPDDDATLQALRAELRPDQPEVDGVLGAEALRLLEVDIDYPHNRVLMRCQRDAPCLARPALAARGDRDQVTGCVTPPSAS